jgi:putative cardiolipin synthase
MRTSHRGLVSILGVLALSGCLLTGRSTSTPRQLTDDVIRRNASAAPLDVLHADVLLGNDAAFRAKLDAIRAAKSSIDAMYYIFSDDPSSSALTQELLAAAKRGVRVRLLLDYHTNYLRLDLLTALEKQARGGPGSLEVRLYNRPTRNIVMDAAYLTIGCGEVGSPDHATCAGAKSAELERRFASDQIDGRPASELDISNLDVANSGLFLSGLYSKHPDVMALAVMRSVDIDVSKLKASAGSSTPQQKEQLAKIGKIYWQSRAASPFRRATAKLQLRIAFAVAGGTLNPIHDAFTSYLPVERRGSAEAAPDWDYLTEFLHHKLLLVDNTSLQLGGRNVEDSYHMRPNALVDKYIFWDTDVHATLRAGGEKVESAFDALWNYRRMVATTDEVRQHAPNDFVANTEAREAAEQACEGATDAAKQECSARELQAHALTLPEREAARLEDMTREAARYWNEYPFAKADDPSPSFTMDPGVFAAYIENLPFHRDANGAPGARSYGSHNDTMEESGKHIHVFWNAGLEQVCRAATPEHPLRVVLHHAYFFPASNLITSLGRMIDGRLDCHNVTVTVLTNSVETTDLNFVNLLARHSIKAFAEHAAAKKDPARSAHFEYFEYRQQDAGKARSSLHTKVSVFGDTIVIGSANADVRSYMMDSNNGLFFRGAPQFMAAYLGYIDRVTHDPALTTNQTRYFATVPRAQILEEDRQVFRAILAKFRVERWLDADQRQSAEEDVVKVLDEAYELTKAILAGGADLRAKEAEFDRKFKAV